MQYFPIKIEEILENQNLFFSRHLISITAVFSLKDLPPKQPPNFNLVKL